MTHRSMRRGALITAACLVLAVCLIVPSVRGALTRIAQQIIGREVRYFNNELQNDGIDTNNYNFGYDRKAAAEADVAAGKAKSVVDWVATKDGDGDFFYSIGVDPALCAAVALHMDQTLKLPETILVDEANVVIGQRADEAHLHFLKDQNYWDRAVRLISRYLTSGSIKIKHESYTTSMYMWYNGLEGDKPSVIVRNSTNGYGDFVVFDLGKPGKVGFRLECGYQPTEVGYWPVPVGPEPPPPDNPEPEPKDPDAGPQGQVPDNPDYGGGQNHDPDQTVTEEPQSPTEYKPPEPPKPDPTAAPTAKPTEVPGDGQDHGDFTQIVEEQHGPDTVEAPVAQDGLNEGDLDESAVE